jgi:death-on-curing protein
MAAFLAVDRSIRLLGADRATITRLPRIALAESALHAPFASFGGVEAYPSLVEQAAVLVEHLAKHHPLPDQGVDGRDAPPHEAWKR